MKPVKRTALIILLFASLTFFVSLYFPVNRGRLSPSPFLSLRLVDRNNTLLREVLSDKGGHCRWACLEDISPHLIRATLASEDKHFYLHPGVNIFSIGRALLQNIKERRIVSGASTITQQLVRNIYWNRRNILSKAFEVWMALRLEHCITKEEILTQYLNRIFYGNQAYGIEAASSLYFDKQASDLSLAEAAFLAGLPRSPIELNPYRHFSRIKKRQTEILKKMYKFGSITELELGRAVQEKICIVSEKEKFRAPHFCQFILQIMPSSERSKWSAIQTTLDYALQEKVEALVREHISSLKSRGISNASVIVLDNASSEILSMVGSKDFFDYDHSGQVNGTLSLRQPGSTLKPFTYGLAFERGMTAATILEDKEIHFKTPQGIYRPKNYDLKFHGPIRTRSALACSYNVPAVSVLHFIGSDLLYLRLKKLGFKSLEKNPSFYGIGLTLGNGEVSLLELVRAYSSLARGGIYLEENSILGFTNRNKKQSPPPERKDSQRVFSPQVAYILTHILFDADARIPSFGYNSPLGLPFSCAAKTGTSKDFRDNWTIGYTPRYTVGVWVGNFDGKPMEKVSGITGCGPLFRDIMLLLGKDGSGGRFGEPEGLVRVKICPLTGKRPTSSCPGIMEEIFIRGTEPHEFCDIHPRDKITAADEESIIHPGKYLQININFPGDGDIFKIDPVLPGEYQSIRLSASVAPNKEIKKIEWWINEELVSISTSPFSLSWQLEPGSYIIKAKIREGNKNIESHPVKITVLS